MPRPYFARLLPARWNSGARRVAIAAPTGIPFRQVEGVAVIERPPVHRHRDRDGQLPAGEIAHEGAVPAKGGNLREPITQDPDAQAVGARSLRIMQVAQPSLGTPNPARLLKVCSW